MMQPDYLRKWLVWPMALASAVFLLLSLLSVFPARQLPALVEWLQGIAVEGLATSLGVLLTVLYVDRVFAQHEAHQWAPVEEAINNRIDRIADAVIFKVFAIDATAGYELVKSDESLRKNTGEFTSYIEQNLDKTIDRVVTVLDEQPQTGEFLAGHLEHEAGMYGQILSTYIARIKPETVKLVDDAIGAIESTSMAIRTMLTLTRLAQRGVSTVDPSESRSMVERTMRRMVTTNLDVIKRSKTGDGDGQPPRPGTSSL